MNIAYIATNSYVPLMGISLTSVLENITSDEQHHFFICSPDMEDNNKKQLTDLIQKYRCSVSFIDMSDYSRYFDFPFQTSGFHPIVLARLVLEHYIPETVNELLYLDCDVIADGDWSILHKVELSGYAFAAVPELHMPEKEKEQIGLQAQDCYYNCGILLVNLEYWREHHLAEKFLQYYVQCQGQLLYNDQDILNHCCRGNIKKLSHRYNYNPALYYFPYFFIKTYQPEYLCADVREYKEIQNKPVLIHFMGEERPWIHGNFSPYRKVYEKYRNASMWKEMKPIYGKETLLFCYHVLNCITRICPWFRKWFTEMIGIYYYKTTKKS